MEIKELQDEVFETAVEHGWWPIRDVSASGFMYEGGKRASSLDLKEVNIPEKLALMHSEISEALEHFRNGTQELFLSGPEGEKPDGMWIELADCIIRILDLAGAYNVDMEYMLRIKADYNRTRPFRHGGKKC